MFYSVISFVLSVIAIVTLLISVRMLFRGTWFWAWVRGMAAMLLLAATVALMLLAWDMHSYDTLLADKPIATVSFEKVDEQAFVATLSLSERNNIREFYLRGDQWQVDARIIRWHGVARTMGGKPGYRLDRISGRYFTLEDERAAERTVYSLFEQEHGIDVWAWAQKSGDANSLFEATYGSAAFVPMADGAMFELALSNSGLVAKPLNNAAQKAVQVWLN